MFTGPRSDKEMRTGMHEVSDIYCKVCSIVIGWHYWKAHEEDQKYKEGKFIIEKAYLIKKKKKNKKIGSPTALQRAEVHRPLPSRF